MNNYFLKVTDNGIVGYIDNNTSVKSVDGMLVGVADNEFDRHNELLLFIRMSNGEVSNVVLDIGENIGSDILRCLPKVDLNLPVFFRYDGIYQNGNRMYPLPEMVTVDEKAIKHRYQMLINDLIKRVSNFTPSNTEYWKYGSEYSLYAVSDCPYYYRGNKLMEYVEGYIRKVSISVDECKLYLEIVDEDVSLYKLDITYPGLLAFEILNALKYIDINEQVMIGKESVYQNDQQFKNVDGGLPQDIVDEFMNRLNTR